MEIPQVTLEIQIRNRKGPKYTRCVFSPTADVPPRLEEILRGLEQTRGDCRFQISTDLNRLPRGLPGRGAGGGGGGGGGEGGQPAAAGRRARDPHGSARCAGAAPMELPAPWLCALETVLPRRARVIVLPSRAGRRGGVGWGGMGWGKRPEEADSGGTRLAPEQEGPLR